MKILAIGNSFSRDATRYLHQIAAADGGDLTIVNLYIGGAPLSLHCENAAKDARDYALDVNGEITERYVSIKEALRSDGWDWVTMQQVSHLSWDYGAYQPYLGALSAYVKKHAPNAAQALHQTWAYEEGSEKLCAQLGYLKQEKMFSDLKNAYDRAAGDIGLSNVIPGGAAFQKMIRLKSAALHRDGFHASLGLGRYVLGLVWYIYFTGNPVSHNPFRDFDEAVSEEDILKAKQCAWDAVLQEMKKGAR